MDFVGELPNELSEQIFRSLKLADLRAAAAASKQWAHVATQPGTKLACEYNTHLTAEGVDWVWISYYQRLSEAFIEKHADHMDWWVISYNQTLSEAIIEKHADRVDWQLISGHQTLSEAFREKHADHLDWLWISGRQKLSEAFIEKHADRIPN